MDPLQAFGLAANVVQFVELSVKLVNEARAVYDSGVGTTAGVTNLVGKMDALQALVVRTSQPVSDDAKTPDQVALVNVSGKARQLASEVMELSGKLTASSPKSKFGVVRVVLKAPWYKSKLGKLEQEIKECCTEIIETWNFMISEEQSSTLNLLKRELENLGEVNNGVRRTVDETKSSLDQTINSIQHQIQYQSDTLEGIKNRIDQILKTTTETQILNDIMKRLRFEEMHTRELQIEDANQHTFRWLLYDEGDEIWRQSFKQHKESRSIHLADFEWELHAQKAKRIQTRSRFLRWLRSDHGLFYISGKPGSGKSTLIKLICSETKTSQELAAWAGEKRLIFARIFFWAAGTEAQRSLEGLYRTMLWEVLRACPKLGKEVFPKSWDSSKANTAGRLDDDGFSIAELRAAFERLVANKEIFQRYRICIFLDGLDEYSGDHWDIAKTVLAWSQEPDIKICVSCRPLNPFEHHFGKNDSRILRLHEHTWSDMLGLITDELFPDERFVAVRDQKDYAKFEIELVTKAEGVFVWLRLAIRELLTALGSKYSLAQLQKRLAMIPGGMENIYDNILDSISRSDQEMAFKTLLVSLELQNFMWSTHARSDIIFSLLDDLADADVQDPTTFCDRTVDYALTDDELKGRCETIRTRINQRCRGLLQASGDGWFSGCQTFSPFHRTVLEHLGQPKILARLIAGAGNFDPRVSLVSCHIRLIRMVVLGEKYHQSPYMNSDDDYYRLCSSVTFIALRILMTVGSVSKDCFATLITNFGDALETHFPSFQRVIRRDERILPWPIVVWKKFQFSKPFFMGDESFEMLFASYLTGLRGHNAYDLWDLIFSQTKYGSQMATLFSKQ
ncbi:hypothetical protein F4810DRAFT_157851 [Camillea tinctor]|nr:hypothetical protein F4810DRAFT_157851 [Camillea tinctor]